MRQVLDEYADQLAARARPRSEKAARQGAAILGRVLGHVAAETLTTRALDDFVVAERARGLRPTSINSRLRLLKSAFRSAVDAGDLSRMPCRVKLLKEPRRMPSILSEEEVKRLLDAAPPRIQAVLEVAMMTGMRRGELVHLQWEDWVPGEGIQIRGKPQLGHEVKDCQDRRVPTSKELDAVLRHRRSELRHRKPEDFVFQRNEGRGSRWDANALGREVRDVFKRAGLWRPGRGLHELRRTSTSRMLEAGVDPRTVQHVLGHSTLMLLERYGAVRGAQLQRAGAVLARIGSGDSED